MFKYSACFLNFVDDTVISRGLSEPGFCGGLVCGLKKIIGSNNFSAQISGIISHYKKLGYNVNVLQQTECLVVNPITAGNFAFLFNCTQVCRYDGSDLKSYLLMR